MKLELSWNKLGEYWWYGVGLCFDKSPYHGKYKNVFRIELLIFSIYFRW